MDQPQDRPGEDGWLDSGLHRARQGDRGRVDRALAGWSVPEHIQAGAQSILVGESVARYFILDAKRSLDYLVSRPEVDPARLGAVGCSGGGALTTYIGALDARVKAVAPACFIMDS